MAGTASESAQRPGEMVGSLIANALDRLDQVAGTRPGNRPAHLDQLAQVLHAAEHEARKADNDPTTVARDADLWRLREPGYLRAICEHPLGRSGGTIVLLPVVITWIALGVAEFLYLRQYTATAAANRPPFFADWLGQPWYRGPIVLSAVIALTVVWIMRRSRRPAREHAVADELDRIVHRLEADLLAPLTILRSRLGPASVADTTRRAAADLSQAANLFLSATQQLAKSMAIVDRLGAVADRLVTVVPELRTQTSQLADVELRLHDSVGELTRQVEPVTAAVGAVTRAGEAAAGTISRSEAVLRDAGTRLDAASAIADRTTELHATLAGANRPFIDAADTVASAAQKLDTTVSAIRDTAAQLHATINEVNWLAMVSDGLRHNDDSHLPPESATDPEQPEPSQVAG